MIYCDRFSYTPAVNNSEVADPTADSAGINEALVGFVHMETKDEDDAGAVETKMVKNLKWAARKNETQTIVLHSFAHLSDSKADPAAIRALLGRAEERLQTSGYNTHQTPFGYFLNLDVQAPGHSLARLYKEF